MCHNLGLIADDLAALNRYVVATDIQYRTITCTLAFSLDEISYSLAENLPNTLFCCCSSCKW